MKSIINQFPNNKISGIYRIFIQIDKHEFCYVSYANNIYGAIKEHRNAILKHFKNSKETQKLLTHYSVPENIKKLFHFAIFLIAKNYELTTENIKYEILETVENKLNPMVIDKLEQKYIDKWQCEKYGFNSPFKYLEKFITATMHNMENDIEIFKKLWSEQENKIKKEFASHDQRHIDNKKWYKNPTNAFVLLDRGYIADSKSWFKNQWKEMFDKISSQI